MNGAETLSNLRLGSKALIEAQTEFGLSQMPHNTFISRFVFFSIDLDLDSVSLQHGRSVLG